MFWETLNICCVRLLSFVLHIFVGGNQSHYWQPRWFSRRFTAKQRAFFSLRRHNQTMSRDGITNCQRRLWSSESFKVSPDSPGNPTRRTKQKSSGTRIRFSIWRDSLIKRTRLGALWICWEASLATSTSIVIFLLDEIIYQIYQVFVLWGNLSRLGC